MRADEWIRSGLPGSTEPMHGLGDLALFLGGDETSFTGRLLELIVKAQATPEHMAGLRRGFPEHVRVWETWMAMSPTPTADQLRAALDNQPPVDGEWEWGAACDIRCDRKDWSYTWGFDDRADAEAYLAADPTNRRLVRRRPEQIEEVGDAG